MTDVLLRHAEDGGDIEVKGGLITLADGLYVAAYLSMFGGNERDSGRQDGEPFEWWGNKGERLPERRYRSQTQHMLRSLPAAPANLKRLENAALSDLAWFVDSGVASFVGVDVSMPGLNRVLFVVRIEIQNEAFVFSIPRDWRAAA